MLYYAIQVYAKVLTLNNSLMGTRWKIKGFPEAILFTNFQGSLEKFLKMQLLQHSSLLKLGHHSLILCLFCSEHTHSDPVWYGTPFKRSYSSLHSSVCWHNLLPSLHRYQWRHRCQETWTHTKGCPEHGTGETPAWISVRGRKYTREAENELVGPCSAKQKHITVTVSAQLSNTKDMCNKELYRKRILWFTSITKALFSMQENRLKCRFIWSESDIF